MAKASLINGHVGSKEFSLVFSNCIDGHAKLSSCVRTRVLKVCSPGFQYLVEYNLNFL